MDERSYTAEILGIIRGGGTDEEIRLSLEEYHDNDIATALEELSPEERENVVRILGSEEMSEIVPYLEDAGEYLSELDTTQAADIIGEMDADEAVEILEDLDEDRRAELLELIEEDVKEDIELLSSYGEDQFGSKMNTSFINVTRGVSVKKAMRKLIGDAPECDSISRIFVTEEDGKFVGVIDLKELIVARSDTPLEELIYTNFPFVLDTESISENIERLRSYSEELIPVISSENAKLLGVLTAVDLIEIVDDEMGDDYAKLAALSSEVEKDEGLFKSMRKRVPWLVILLFLGLCVSAIVSLFEGVIDELPMIVAFQSLILGMAGNVGTQSLAITVRSLGSGDELGFKDRFLIIMKETQVAFLNGLALGLFSFVIVGIYLLLLGGLAPTVALTSAVCVGAALWFAMTISGFTGAAIPICFYRMGIDPAVASGPLITTVNDLVAVVSYYGLAWALLVNLV